MKNLFVCTLFLLGIYSLSAQDISDHTIGLRLGSNRGFGTEISYQMKLNSENRAEFNLGWRSSNSVSAMKLNGLYQWVWLIEDGFNWYAGVGGGLGTYSNNTANNSSRTFLFAAGDIGIEYNFNFPLQASLDLRPEIGGNGYFENSFGIDIALGIRYKF
ncbi:MAG: hypothetical protein EXR18_03630 [Flavobacteriaceae bacterium]|nr:hypothetical protein [Flavobacteriaceae bacterium]